MGIIFIIVVIIGVICLVAYYRIPQCLKCGKRNQKEINRQEVESQRINIEKTVRDRTITTHTARGTHSTHIDRHVTVPGKRVFYDVTYKCQECGAELTRREHKDVEV